MTEPIRIANASGFYGDRATALHDMVVTDGVDVVTGDYLAELTMLILARDRLKDTTLGYAKTFLRHLEAALPEALERGVKIVSNAGGLNPAGLANAIRTMADNQGLEVSVAHVEGDDLRDRAGELGLGEPLAANAYLGAWGIAECLRAGADVVVTGRVTDASLVVGPAAWHHGWQRDEYDALAGAVAAGHVIECGPQATGGNYAFFTELPDRNRPLGFPIAEVHADGTSVITKPADTGGAVTVGTVTAQLLYEITGARYAGPDVTTRFDTVTLTDDGPDRVRITGVRGEAPPPTLKVGRNTLGGFRNSVTFVLTGLDVEPKAAWVQSQLADLGAQWTLARTDHPDADTQEAASALLHCVVRGPDPTALGRAFSGRAIELALASIPGFHVTAPPGEASPYGVFDAAYVAASEVPHVAVLPDGRRVDIVPSVDTLELDDVPEPPVPPTSTGPARRAPLGRVIGARSGDKGGSANIGVWARTDDAFAWIAATLTVDEFRRLLPETARLDVRRHVLPNLRALNFVVEGLLGEGVAYNARHDPAGQSGRRMAALPRRRNPGRTVACLNPYATPRTRHAARDGAPLRADRGAAEPGAVGAGRRAAALAVPARRRARPPRAVVPRGRRRRGWRRRRCIGAGRGVPLRGRVQRCVRVAVHHRHRAAPHRPRRRRGTDRQLRRPAMTGEMIGSLAITEPDGGSDVANIRTTAKRDGDEYVINGAKTYITSAVRGDFVVTAARTGDAGAHGISLIVVDKGTPGFTVSRKLAKMGWLCSDTAELSYADVRVPATNLIGEENSGFIQIAQNFVSERIGLAVQAYACAQRCLDLTVEWCRERDTFGRPLISRQTVQHTLAEMARRVEVARVYTRSVAQRAVEEDNLILEACFAKNTAIEAGEWVANQAVQLHGGMGYMREAEVERQYRDMRILGIGGGTTEILTGLAAKMLGYLA